MPAWVRNIMGTNYLRLGMNKKEKPGILAPILGGYPDETMEPYNRYSPISYVDAGCPPTLILQGEHDLITPAGSNQKLYRRLKDRGVAAVLHLIPQTDHAFDLIIPSISPTAHAAYYDIERFLAIVSKADTYPKRTYRQRDLLKT
jgi:acetyl esterase/lipase